MRCQDCIFWKRDGERKFGTCGSEKFVYDADESGFQGDELHYWDHESYSASFETGENFGCVHFRPKETDGREV
mgnify:CR=1 FL=1